MKVFGKSSNHRKRSFKSKTKTYSRLFQFSFCSFLFYFSSMCKKWNADHKTEENYFCSIREGEIDLNLNEFSLIKNRISFLFIKMHIFLIWISLHQLSISLTTRKNRSIRQFDFFKYVYLSDFHFEQSFFSSSFPLRPSNCKRSWNWS